MKQITGGLLCLLLFLPLTTANVYITEVMHSPTQVADSEGEWIELYNDAQEALDLSSWTLDGKSLGNKTIPAKTYFVLARELLDNADVDGESFESYWGNNNRIWDESFLSSEVSLSLKDEDTIVLTNGISTETVSYNLSFGGKGGRTIERVSLTQWKEGEVDGTPGFGNFSTAEKSDDGIELIIYLLNNMPEILTINLTDDLDQEGIQILPAISGEKKVFLEVAVNDTDGFEDLEQVSFLLWNQSTNMSFKKNLSASVVLYEANFTFTKELPAGEYNIEVQVSDGENQTKKNVSLTYEGILSTQLNVSRFEMEMHGGDAALRSVQILNSGNIPIDTEISAEDLFSAGETIEKSSIEVFQDVWIPLANPLFLDLNVAPQKTQEIQLRIQTPQAAKSGIYKGRIFITSMESEDGE